MASTVREGERRELDYTEFMEDPPVSEEDIEIKTDGMAFLFYL